MILFARPWLLLLLAVPLLLACWLWRRDGGRVALPFDHGRPRQGRWLAASIHLFELAPIGLLAIAIVLLAGPQRLGLPRNKRVLTNIEFCVDISGSMTAPFGGGTRYDASMRAIDSFLDYREGDAFGLTFFGHNVLHWVPLTSDTSAIRCAPPFMRPENAPPWFGGTEIGKALTACREVLVRREEGDRMIILVSDGDSSDLADDNDLRIAKELRARNITVHAIHISDTEIPGPIANITSLTGGELFQPGDPEGLKAVFERIDQMQATRLEKTVAETLDDFLPWCRAGCALVVVGLISLLGMRFTPW